MANKHQPVAARQMRQLEQMTESSKRTEVAHGLAKMVENIESLLREADGICSTAPRASTILTQIAAEEAGKGLLLVDYVRPYRNVTPQQRSKHLKSVYSHLARGIYVEYYKTRPDRFAEVEAIINGYRASHYLDGPSDMDWIFRNEIEEARERELYVDLTSDEEGLRWYSPTDLWERLAAVGHIPSAFEPICYLFLRMHETHLFCERALAIMAETWKSVSISSQTCWADYLPVNQAFLNECNKYGLLSSTTTDRVLAEIANGFLYPLCGLGLEQLEVHREELHERRARHLGFLNKG